MAIVRNIPTSEKVTRLRETKLQQVVGELFPQEKILINVKKETLLRNPTTGYCLELDVWVPNLKIGFEFQDPYHYTSTLYSHQSIAEVKEKDNIKQFMVESRGDTLISVPFWWDGDKESLAATIRLKRPDLLKNLKITRGPVSDIVPSPDHFALKIIPGIGQLMAASFPLSTPFNTSIGSKNAWWMGEKYDGVRCCWNGAMSKLFTRSGLEIVIPTILSKVFGKTSFDGEIWFGKNAFIEAQQLIQSTTYPSNLENLRIVAFDDPTDTASEFEIRFHFLLDVIPREHPILIIPARMKCVNRFHLSKQIKNVLKDGGEGVILQKFASKYERGTSSDLLKLKATRGDKEALVVTANSNGSYILQLPNGFIFKVNADNVNIEQRAAVGDIVTFSYQNIAKFMVPVKPTIERIRKDVSWENVVADEVASTPTSLNTHSTQVVEYAPRTYGYWVHSKRRQMRAFFEKIARKMGIDPVIPTHWYSLDFRIFKQFKGVKSLLVKFEGSLIKALLYLFPDIGLELSKFPRKTMSIIRRRRIFDNVIADKLRINPSIPENWPLLIIKLREIKEIKSIVENYYSSKLVRAIFHLYPEIRNHPRCKDFPGYWDLKRNRKTFFDEIAKEHSFDPRVATNWYSISEDDITSKQGSSTILRYYNGNISKAIERLYGIVISSDKFYVKKVGEKSPQNPFLSGFWQDKHRRGFWELPKNRKQFFDEFARDNNFDPLLPENWYQVTERSILFCKYSSSVLRYYEGSFTKALESLYPDIGLNFT